MKLLYPNARPSRSYRKWLPLLIGAILPMGAAHASVLCVKKAGTGSNTGCWATAYTELQPALTAASPGDEIWVAAGTYLPSNPVNTGASFHWRQGITVYGGFAGTETSLSQRNAVANSVILSGDLGTAGHAVNLLNQDNSGPLSSKFDGLTFTGANGNVLSLLSGTSLDVVNCIFKNNTVTNGVIGGRGLVLSVSLSLFENNTSSGLGGALSLTDDNSASIQNCTFNGNHSDIGGGAIFADKIVTMSIVNCLLKNNTSLNGAAILFVKNDKLRIISCTLSGNTSTGNQSKGGAIEFSDAQSSPTVIQNSIFWNNSAAVGSEIHLVGTYQDNLRLGNNVIRGGLVPPYVVSDGYPVTNLGGNISSDPRFVSATEFTLQAGSPAIDVGIKVSDWDAIYPRIGANSVDLAGGNRFRGPTQAIDIGAYEFQGVNHYIITAQANGCGTLSPSGSVPVPEFTNQVFNFQPDLNCIVSDVLVDNVSQPLDIVRGYHTFQNVTSTHSISVTFVSGNTIPFQETWENGSSRWNTNFSGGSGVIDVNDHNMALCLDNGNSSATLGLSPASANTFSVKFKIDNLIGSSRAALLKVSRDNGSTIPIDIVGDLLEIDHIGVQQFSLAFWHELRGEVDLTARKINWFLDNGQNPFYTSTNIDTHPFSGIRIEGGSLTACVDDIYLGNENTLTVNPTTNGSIDVAAGWIRTTPGVSPKYVYRQLPGGIWPKAGLQALPKLGYSLQSWTGDASSYGSTISISLPMTASKSVSATFKDAPTYTVLRRWNGVDQPLITVKEGVVFNTLDNLTSPLTPPLANFSNWMPKPSATYPGRFVPSDQSRKGQVFGGNLLLEAQFYAPQVQVEVKDDAYEDADADNTESEPRIKITNNGKAILTDYYFEYYFHSECLNTPDIELFDAPLRAQLFDLNGGNFKIRFHPPGPLNPGGILEQINGRIHFSCSQTEPTCPKIWKWDNDYSLGRADDLREYQITPVLPVYVSDPGPNYPPSPAPVTGTSLPRDFIFDDPAPNPALKSPTQYAIPSSTDLPIPFQYPNLTTIHAFPLGTTLVNGSFELDTLGWRPYPENVTMPPGATRWEIGFHSVDLQAYDGFRYLRVKAHDNLEKEGATLRIEEGDPSFTALMAQDGKGLTGQGAVLSAWVRLPAPGTGSVRFVLGRDGGYEYFDPIALDPLGTWTFIQKQFPQLHALEDANGHRSIQLAIVEGDEQNGDFLLDGVTLTPGNVYSAPNISHKLSNTRGAPLQTRVRLPAENPGLQSAEGTEIVTNTQYDDVGREWKSYLPYSEPCPAQSCNPYFQASALTPDVISRANQHYDSDPSDGLPDAGGFAYSEKLYEKDQVSTLDKKGMPGVSYQVNSGHVGLMHYSGVNDLSLASLTSNSGTFTNPGNKNDPTYAYRHSVDEDGKESMEWKNGFGQVVQTVGVLDKSTGQYAVTRNIYDSRGNLKRVLPPLSCRDENDLPTNIPSCADPIVNDYDDENHLIKETHPDAGETRYFYDRIGQKRGMQTFRQFLDRTATIYVFDDLGRVLYSGEYKDLSTQRSNPEETEQFLRSQFRDVKDWPSEYDLSRLFTKYYYDRMPYPMPVDLLGRAPDFLLYPVEMQGNFDFTKSRLCAVVQFHDPMQAFDPSYPIEPVSSTAYRYDKFGRIIATYTYNGFITEPGFKLQKTETDYDIAGHVIQTRHFRTANQSAPERLENFVYNARNQLKEITDKDGASLSRYDYIPEDGKVRTLTLGADGTAPITVQYQYHISGAISKITSTKTFGGTQNQEFSQQLYYDLLPGNQAGLFNGNIARQEYKLASLPIRSVAYQYDRLNRMVNAAYDVTGTGTDPAEFDEQVEYMLDGRISELRRANGVGSSTDGGPYKYYSNSHKLSRVGAGRFPQDPRAVGTDQYPAFLYDEDGNMVWDQSKNLELSYDYRGLPTHFGYVKNGQEYDMETRYDHAGNRISKVVFTRGASSGGGQTSLRSEMIVDKDPSHTQDYALLADAYTSIKSQLNGVTQDPGTLTLYVVVAPDQVVDVTNLAAWDPITYPGGTAKTVLQVVKYGSADYYAVLNRRSEVMQLVSANHYTGFGNEIREDFQVNKGIKTLIDLPQGMGRYEEHGGQLYYVKNNLGSTMLASLSTGSGFQSYDYLPYGIQKSVQNLTTDKVRETFTGKELDDETGIGGLYYFGVRYYDPDLGLWISPDLARQFYSPYGFSNNPNNSVDPNGNKEFKIFDIDAGKGQSPFRVDDDNQTARFGIGVLKLSFFWGKNEESHGYELGFNLTVKGGIADSKYSNPQGSNLSGQVGTGEFGAGLRLIASKNPLYTGIAAKLGLDLTAAEGGAEVNLTDKISGYGKIGYGLGLSGKLALTGTGASGALGAKLVEGAKVGLKLGDVNKVDLK